ncbi:1-(5-phosphoribosyl)-5-[(5-phosphoribosylamino)methylideneamino]imidazole-4-carboxamide isomerase [Prochlorococcus sp. MIT 1307]|uniref:1-(5-phosphoribosyl)-5-[(5- phosphoribosylamino)methylideneamino]imidazole-4- carboxamide isomerase n=1 Tax=Prochlorococcus sp. MIT 1307 TaxID=3096219 RepID=UPI002A749C9F|nr:1-(5-phosphoribosyl)-5-[(5-phosphoribosylamino)methylideneamino]imidazole-4-carboxamide isomerase [Prochlorococcus sp. MIT 1307]
MEIIPAIDLLEGNCVRLNQGDYKQVTHFNSDPLTQALSWQEQGATRLHLVDLDGAKTGLPINDSSIRKITQRLEIPIQIGGGIRTLKRAEELISYGVGRVILGTVAIEKPELVKNLAQRHPEKILIGIDAKKGKVATRGWLNQSNILATDLAKNFHNSGIAGIITTDISKDGTLQGPNLNAMKEIASVSSVPVIASGGIGSTADIISLLPLEAYGVSGVIVGRALYDGTVNLQEAQSAINKGHLEDPIIKKNFIV